MHMHTQTTRLVLCVHTYYVLLEYERKVVVLCISITMQIMQIRLFFGRTNALTINYSRTMHS